MSVFFNGRVLVTPAVESTVDDSAMLNNNASTGQVLALIGRSAGGQPKTPIHLRSPAHAKQVLRDGEGLRAVELAFAASSETLGLAEVVFTRVNPATQSSLTLKDGSTNNVITLKSTDYGLYTNAITVKIESGTTTGKRLTTQIGARVYSKDNIARDAFTAQYTGSGTVATIAVSNSAVTLVVDGTTTTLDLNVYTRVQDVVDRINAESGWTATSASGSATTTALNGLDTKSTTAAKASAVTITANLQACVDWFNGINESLVTATRVAGAGAVPANIAATGLTGGSDGVTASTDWSDCFDALQTEDVHVICPLTSESAVWAMADAHCAYMSSSGRRERRAFVGDSTGVEIDDAAAHALTINSDRTSYVWPGIYVNDELGAITLRQGYFHAAMVAAGFCGLNPGNTMTNKSLRIKGLEVEPKVTTDTDILITAGVITTIKTSSGYRVARAVSTWLNDTKFNKVEVSCGIATDFTARTVRDGLSSFIGSKNSPESRALIESHTESVLRRLATAEPQGPGVLAGDEVNPAYRNIAAEVDGDVVRLSFECSPVVPLNYILVSMTVSPYSTTTAA